MTRGPRPGDRGAEVEVTLPELPVSPNQGGFTDVFKATGIDFNDTFEVLNWLDD